MTVDKSKWPKGNLEIIPNTFEGREYWVDMSTEPDAVV